MNPAQPRVQRPMPWFWLLGGVVVGAPLVVVLPVLAVMAMLVCGFAGLAMIRQRAAGSELLALSIGLLVPSTAYFALAVLRSG